MLAELLTQAIERDRIAARRREPDIAAADVTAFSSAILVICRPTFGIIAVLICGG